MIFVYILGGIFAIACFQLVWNDIKLKQRKEKTNREIEEIFSNAEKRVAQRKDELKELLPNLQNAYKVALAGADKLGAIEAGRAYYKAKREYDDEDSNAELRDEARIQTEVGTMR